MGLLDDVIGAALGAKPTQGQTAQGQPAQDQFLANCCGLNGTVGASNGAASAPKRHHPRRRPHRGSRRCSSINSSSKSGLGDVINSWIGTGQNQAVSPNQLRSGARAKTINDLSRQSGAPQDDLLSQLSRYLPGVIDRLTPERATSRSDGSALRVSKHLTERHGRGPRGRARSRTKPHPWSAAGSRLPKNHCRGVGRLLLL